MPGAKSMAPAGSAGRLETIRLGPQLPQRAIHPTLDGSQRLAQELGDPGLLAVEARDTVAKALGALSGEERDAVALRFGADLTVPEIAKLLREPLTTVEGRVYRALRKLRAETDRLEPPG